MVMRWMNRVKQGRGSKIEAVTQVRKTRVEAIENRLIFNLLSMFFAPIILLYSNISQAVDFEWVNLGVADGANVANPSLTGTGSTLVMNVATVLVIDGVERPLTDIDANGQITDADAPIDTIDFDTINNGPFSYENSPSGGISQYLHMEMEHDTCEANDKLVVRLTFENALGDAIGVRDLGFTLTDVDQSDFDDAVQVFADGVNVRDIPAVTVTLGGNVEENNVAGLRGWDGLANTGNGSAAANIDFDFPTTYTVSELEIRYSSNQPCDTGVAPSNQKIGLTDITIADATTPATINRFSSQKVGESVLFSWESSNEVGHLGYQIYNRDEAGWHLLNPSLIVQGSANDAMSIKRYEYSSGDARGEWFTLVDVSTAEELTAHGPYRLGEDYGESLQEPMAVDWQAIRLERENAKRSTDSIKSRLEKLKALDSQEAE